MSTPPNRLVISSISLGLITYQKPFIIDNVAFPTLQNAICWRKQLIKKPGSAQIPSTSGSPSRLQRMITSTGSNPVMTLNGSGAGSSNLLSGFSLETATGAIVPKSISFTDGTNTYAEPGTPDGTLIGTPGGSGVINYATGAVTISGGAAGQNLTGTFSYYPGLPPMGIEAYESDAMSNSQIDFPLSVFFDTTYSYQYNGANFIDNSFYKSGSPITWHGANYQQFFTSNYYRALFVTNNVPGAQFLKIASITFGNPTTTFTTTNNHNLVTGDYVFINEVAGGAGDIVLLNMLTFQITVTGVKTFTVPVVTTGALSGGAVQVIQKASPDGFGDGITWYDGLGATLGFANFSPPLDNLSTSATTYLVGCRIILPFGNRLLAIGTFEATSAQILASTSMSFAGIYNGNIIRYCEVTATPFYSTSPANTTAVALAWASNIQGYGGFVQLDTTQRIISAAVTQGAMILGLESEQRRMSLTGIETDPFSLEIINPEYGSAGTHAFVPMGKGILTVGEYGFLQTSSYDSERFDFPIIDQIFQLSANNNGFERICGSRDFANEVVYFSYCDIDNLGVFPDTTLVYNYREPSFSIWKDSSTTYGIYKLANQTWSALTDFTWAQWDEPWQSGEETDIYPYAAYGTPQGFILLKWDNPSKNDPSLFVQAITGNTITSPNHNLASGMYLGIVPFGSYVPALIGQVVTIIDQNNFVLDTVTGIVPGLTSLSIIDQPFIETKQFQFAWSDAKKTRIGAQKYFMDTTLYGEFTVNILGNQSGIPLNNNTVGNPLPSLISNAIVRTRPDQNLGINNNQKSQSQIWHRLSSSCVGDTIQLQFTFSDAQMRNINISTSPWKMQALILDLYPSRILA